MNLMTNPGVTTTWRLRRRVRNGILIAALLPAVVHAQTAVAALTWEQVKAKFEAANPTLRAAQLNIDESRAAETTAYLRPNPTFGVSADGLQIHRDPDSGIWQPLAGVVETPSLSYLHER